MSNISKGLATLLVIVGLLVGGIFTYAVVPREVTKTVPTDKLVVQEVVVGNLTDVSDVLKDIQNTIKEVDNWETTAFDLATAEWSDKDNKAIFNELSDIEEREDIDSVVVVDSEVISSNVDEGNAVVEQRLKIRYEDINGDNKKVYFIVTTTIEDGEVEDQEFELD